MQLRDKRTGKYKKRLRSDLGLMLSFMLAIVLLPALIFAGNELLSEHMSSEYEQIATTTPVVVRDNAQKLGDALAESMRSLEDARATLDRAQSALEQAHELYDSALEDFNAIAGAINIYNGEDAL